MQIKPYLRPPFPENGNIPARYNQNENGLMAAIR
jgi:hypothetical protein